MLEITKQIKETILNKRLDLDATLKELKKASGKYNEVVNYINISVNNDNTIYCWCINYNEVNNKYNYLNGGKADTLPLHEAKNYKKLLLDLINLKSDDFKTEAQKVLKNNFYVKELENNKPSIMLKAKNNCFVSFAIFGSHQKINEINRNDDKKEYSANFLKASNNYWDAKTIRKEAQKVFAVYNKKYAEYIRLQDEAEQKRQNRKNNKINDFMRFNYCDKDFQEAKNIFNFTIYNFSYNSLTDHRFDSCPSACISYNGNKYDPKADNRREVFNYMIDKNGYFILKKKAELYQRAKELKRQRQQEAKEKAHQLWINSPKDEEEKALHRYLTDLQNKIILLSDFNSLLNSDNFSILKKWRELYLNFAKQLNYSNYTDAQEWGDKLNEKIKEFNFYNKAVNKGVFNKIACYHQYDLINDVYVMNNKADQFWREHYINKF